VIFWHDSRNENLSERIAVSIPKRVAVTEVSHWHSVNDASYLHILRDLGCDIVGVSDRFAQIAEDRAQRFGGTLFTDYRQMIEATKPEFVIALGRHSDMPEIFRFLVDAGVPFVMEKPWGPTPRPSRTSPVSPPPRAPGSGYRSCPAIPSGR
jgi:hypothetical protein